MIRARVSTITRDGSVLQSGWFKEIDSAKTLFRENKSDYPDWVHVLEFKDDSKELLGLD